VVGSPSAWCFASRSISVVVTAAAHTSPLADGISEAECECEGGDANEQSHSRQHIGTAQCFLSDHREFLRGTTLGTRFQKTNPPPCAGLLFVGLSLKNKRCLGGDPWPAPRAGSFLLFGPGAWNAEALPSCRLRSCPLVLCSELSPLPEP